MKGNSGPPEFLTRKSKNKERNFGLIAWCKIVIFTPSHSQKKKETPGKLAFPRFHPGNAWALEELLVRLNAHFK